MITVRTIGWELIVHCPLPVGRRSLPISPVALSFLFRPVMPMSRASLGLIVLATAIAYNIAVVHAADEAMTIGADDIEFFEQKVRPLLVTRCFECHSEKGNGEKGTGGKDVKGGLHLDSRAGILAGGDSGPAVVPRQPVESLFIEAINYSQDSAQMSSARGAICGRLAGDLEPHLRRTQRGRREDLRPPQVGRTVTGAEDARGVLRL